MVEFLMKNRWAVRPYALVCLLVSPILFPVMILWEERRELAGGYADLFTAIRRGGEVFND